MTRLDPPAPPDPRKEAPAPQQQTASMQNDTKPAPIITDYASL